MYREKKGQGNKVKGKIAAIFLCFSVILGVGVTVAYHNTRAYGFDEQVKIIDYNDEKIKIFDYYIYFENVKSKSEKIKKYVPLDPYTI